jgi:hypothetical protein
MYSPSILILGYSGVLYIQYHMYVFKYVVFICCETITTTSVNMISLSLFYICILFYIIEKSFKEFLPIDC